MGQNLCGQVERENICGIDDNLLWSYVTAKDGKYISIDLLFDEESCLNFKKRHKLFKKFKRMMRECDDYVLVRILEFDMDKSFKKEITKSIEHLDFEDIFTGDGNTDSRPKIFSDYNSDADVESESDDHNTTMKTTCFDKPEPFIPIHEIPALRAKSFIDLHEQPLEISRQKTIEDLSKLESGSIKEVSNERLDSGFEEEQEEQYSQYASALTKLNIHPNLLSEIHEVPERHVVSGYVSVDNFICDSNKNIELDDKVEFLKHGISREKIKGARSKQLCHESIDHKCTSDCCCHGQHKVVETDKRRHTRKYVDEDCCRTAPRHTRQESNFYEYYQNLLKGFFERHDLHVETRKSFSFSDYVQKFDDYMYFSGDYSLSHLDKQGKDDVLKLLILGVDLVRYYDRQYHVLPINGLQKYFEQMSVPVSSRPAHVETMRYEWVRVRSYWSFPSNIRVSPIAMARVGFYYTGKCTECKCFSCGKVYKEWQDGDDPYVIHQQISPNCPYMNGQESENVPIHEEDRLQPRHHIDQTLVPSTAPVNPARVAAEAAAVRIPGLSSTEISRIPVSGSAGQGTPLGTSQSGDFSFRFPSTQSGSSTQSAVVNQASSSYFARPQQPNQNVGQSSVPASSSQGVTNPTVGKENSLSASKNSGTPPQSQQPSNTQQNISSLSTSQREETTLGMGFPTMATQTQFSEGTATTRSVPASSPATVAQSLVGTQKPTSVTTQSQSTANTTSASQSQTPPAITNTTSTSSSTGGSSRTGASGSSSTGASGSSSTGASGSSKTTVGSQPTRTKFDPLGINFEKPRYPTYAVLTVRINTYNGWPTYLDQTPRAMAMAGFFYAGYGDYTRCFFCGGGLRNWEAGDDPWVEHARWFPKCAFLRQNRGDNFVAKVQARHHEVESVNQPILSPQLSVLDDERPANIMSSVPVQTLREMGKDDSIINEAIDRWKANRRRTGQPITSVEMQATELYEIILQIEDERTQGASAQPSTGQQLSLSTNQAPTQTTDDTNEQPTVAEGTSQELPAYLEGFDLVLKEYEEQKERLTCRICTENPVAVAFLPCGHLVCCLDCAPAMRKCPICHELVKGTIKTFFP